MTALTLVTGASRGLGLALAQRLAARGRPLLLVARSLQALEAHAIQLQRSHNVPVHIFACDLSRQHGIDALVEHCQGRTIDGLINNAGVGLGQSFVHQDPKALANMLFLNVQATAQLSRHFAPDLIKHKGFLLNVASLAAFQAVPHFAAYAASKAFVLHLTEALHHELACHGVKVVALCPGATQTEFFEQAGIDTKKTLFKLGPIADVVDAALSALDRNQAIVVPGWSNKAATLIQRLVSRQMVVRISARLMQP